MTKKEKTNDHEYLDYSKECMICKKTPVLKITWMCVDCSCELFHKINEYDENENESEKEN